jgi:hypothetical protein
LCHAAGSAVVNENHRHHMLHVRLAATHLEQAMVAPAAAVVVLGQPVLLLVVAADLHAQSKQCAGMPGLVLFGIRFEW